MVDRKKIESQIFVIEKLLEEQTAIASDGKWNPKYFSLKNKLKKLFAELRKSDLDLDKNSWNEYLSK